jgi:hypothetical protein
MTTLPLKLNRLLLGRSQFFPECRTTMKSVWLVKPVSTKLASRVWAPSVRIVIFLKITPIHFWETRHYLFWCPHEGSLFLELEGWFSPCTDIWRINSRIPNIICPVVQIIARHTSIHLYFIQPTIHTYTHTHTHTHRRHAKNHFFTFRGGGGGAKND